MKRNTLLNGKAILVLTLAFAAVMGFSALAFAGWGEGHGNHVNGNAGYGNNGHGNHGYGNRGNVDDATYEAMVKQREAFMEKTADTRRELTRNQTLLQAEMLEETPDEGRVKELRNEIATLGGKMEQFELAHVTEMKKLGGEYVAFCMNGMGHATGYRGGNGMHHGMNR